MFCQYKSIKCQCSFLVATQGLTADYKKVYQLLISWAMLYHALKLNIKMMHGRFKLKILLLHIIRHVHEGIQST